MWIHYLKDGIIWSVYSMTALMVILCLEGNVGYVLCPCLVSIRDVFSNRMTVAL